jgi:hypothetical protein
MYVICFSPKALTFFYILQLHQSGAVKFQLLPLYIFHSN